MGVNVYRTEETSIIVKHNIEVAHRLYWLPGKCEAIHGHSMDVKLELYGEVNDKGILGGMDFGGVKKEFRNFLDTEFDHRILLNRVDPWAQPVINEDEVISDNRFPQLLPGLQPCDGDPTTENIARWIAQWSLLQLPWAAEKVKVTVNETKVNAARIVLSR